MSDEEQITETQTRPTTAESMVDFLVGDQESPESEEALAADNPEVSDDETTDTSVSDDEQPTQSEEATEEENVEESDDDDPEQDESEETTETDEEEEDQESEEEEPESETLFEVNGESLTADELKAGYLRQSDYTTKTQELAEAREGLAQQAENLKQYEDTLAQNLTLSLQVLEPQLADLMNTDWDTLLEQDAYAYQQRRGEFEQAQYRYAQVQESAKQQVAQRQQQAQEALNAKRTAEQEKLLLRLPDLADARKGRDLAHSIKEYAIKEVGLTEAESSSMIDHRLIVVLNKARQFDEMQQAGLAIADKKIKKGPIKTISSGQPQTKSSKQARSSASAKDRLKKTGSADVLAEMLLSG